MASKPNVTWKPAAAGNFKVGRSAPISQITFHHIVGDANGAIARFQTPGEEASSTYVIGSDGSIYQMVQDKDTPYTDGNYSSNSRSITIEHAGGHPNVPYTEAMYQASARLVAWLIETYGINRFERHRDVSDKPTACPGTLDVERIVRTAKNGGNAMRTPIAPDLVRQHYINYTGTDPGVNSPALSNRFEDPVDDEFWYGLAGHINNVRKGQQGTIDTQANLIIDLKNQIADLGKRPTAEQLAALQKAAEDAFAAAAEAKQKLEEAKKIEEADKAAGESFLRRLGQLIKKYLGGN